MFEGLRRAAKAAAAFISNIFNRTKAGSKNQDSKDELVAAQKAAINQAKDALREGKAVTAAVVKMVAGRLSLEEWQKSQSTLGHKVNFPSGTEMDRFIKNPDISSLEFTKIQVIDGTRKVDFGFQNREAIAVSAKSVVVATTQSVEAKPLEKSSPRKEASSEKSAPHVPELSESERRVASAISKAQEKALRAVIDACKAGVAINSDMIKAVIGTLKPDDLQSLQSDKGYKVGMPTPEEMVDLRDVMTNGSFVSQDKLANLQIKDGDDVKQYKYEAQKSTYTVHDVEKSKTSHAEKHPPQDKKDKVHAKRWRSIAQSQIERNKDGRQNMSSVVRQEAARSRKATKLDHKQPWK